METSPVEDRNRRQRYVVLDSYRFMAAFGIVLYHFNAHFSAFRPPQPDALDRLQTLVDFFFVLSGFVMMHTYGDGIRDLGSYGDFLQKRLARIYPLHLLTILICVTVYLVARWWPINMRDISLVDMRLVPANLLLVHAWGFTDRTGLNGPSWSISAEAFVYVLFPCLAAIRWRPIQGLGLAFLIAIAIELVRWCLGWRSGDVATFDFGMLRAVPMFLAGICVCQLVSMSAPRAISWFVPYALSAVIFGLMLLGAPAFTIDILYPGLVATIAMAERGQRPTILKHTVFVELGNASFAIYMLHTFIAVACVRLVHATGWTSTAALLSIATAGTAVILVLGVVSFRYFETPMRRWLGGPKRSKKKAIPYAVAGPQPRLRA